MTKNLSITLRYIYSILTMEFVLLKSEDFLHFSIVIFYFWRLKLNENSGILKMKKKREQKQNAEI